MLKHPRPMAKQLATQICTNSELLLTAASGLTLLERPRWRAGEDWMYTRTLSSGDQAHLRPWQHGTPRGGFSR